METIDNRTSLEKLYDRAYQKGLDHAILLCEVCSELGEPLSYAIEKLKEHQTEKTINT